MSWLTAIAFGAVAAWALFKLLFEDLEDFGECVKFWLTPDVVSWFRGEWAEDWWNELRLWLWAMGTVAAGAGGYYLVGHYLR